MVITSADPCEQQKLLQLTLLSLYALFDVSDYSLMSLMTDDFGDTLMTLGHFDGSSSGDFSMTLRTL